MTLKNSVSNDVHSPVYESIAIPINRSIHDSVVYYIFVRIRGSVKHAASSSILESTWLRMHQIINNL
jgi:hypothetical protein